MFPVSCIATYLSLDWQEDCSARWMALRYTLYKAEHNAMYHRHEILIWHLKTLSLKSTADQWAIVDWSISQVMRDTQPVNNAARQNINTSKQPVQELSVVAYDAGQSIPELYVSWDPDDLRKWVSKSVIHCMCVANVLHRFPRLEKGDLNLHLFKGWHSFAKRSCSVAQYFVDSECRCRQCWWQCWRHCWNGSWSVWIIRWSYLRCPCHLICLNSWKRVCGHVLPTHGLSMRNPGLLCHHILCHWHQACTHRQRDWANLEVPAHHLHHPRHPSESLGRRSYSLVQSTLFLHPLEHKIYEFINHHHTLWTLLVLVWWAWMVPKTHAPPTGTWNDHMRGLNGA